MVPRHDGQPDYLFEPFFCAALQFSFAGTDAPLLILWKTALEFQKVGPFAKVVDAWENLAASDTNGRLSCCAAASNILFKPHFLCCERMQHEIHRSGVGSLDTFSAAMS